MKIRELCLAFLLLTGAPLGLAQTTATLKTGAVGADGLGRGEQGCMKSLFKPLPRGLAVLCIP